MKILIAGAAGRLGLRLRGGLEKAHDLVLADLKPVDDPRFVQVDIMDFPSVCSAMRGCDAVVHMVIADFPSCAPVDSLRYGVSSLNTQVIGIYNVLRAALESGVRRFVYTSSVSAVDGMPCDARVASDTRHYSHSIYGLTKGFGEDLCRMYHHSFNLSVAVLRLGTIFAPEGGGVWIGNVYYPDMARLPAYDEPTSRVHVDDVICAIARAVEAAEPDYALTHVVGADSGGLWDLDEGFRLYGWRPRYAFARDGQARLAADKDAGWRS